MTPITRVSVSIRRCSRHGKAVMLCKYFLFTRLNVFQTVENRLINNRRRRLCSQIICNDVKKTILYSPFKRGFKSIQCRHGITDFICRAFSNGTNAISVSCPVYAFMYFLFTLPTEMWRMPGCHVCRIPHFLISLSLLL